MYITLDEAKKHLNVESDFTEDDSYITSLIEVAEAKVSAELCLKSTDDLKTLRGGEVIPPPIKQAIMLTIGLYYNNREEVTVSQTHTLAQGALHLIQLYRDYSL